MTRGDNSGKTRNMRWLFFHEESIHEVSRRYLEHEYIHTYIHTYIRTCRNQYVPHFFKVGGIIKHMSIVDIFIMQRAITLHKLMKMQITHKKHFWPFWSLVFGINHICSNSYVFTIRKNTSVMIVDIKKSLFTKSMLIS